MDLKTTLNSIVSIDKRITRHVINAVDDDIDLETIVSRIKSDIDTLKSMVGSIHRKLKRMNRAECIFFSTFEYSVLNDIAQRWNSLLSYAGKPATIRHHLTSSPQKLHNVKSGTVISISGEKTVKVDVHRTIQHERYKKFITKHKSYLVHDEHNRCSIGDRVLISETRKLSSRKYHNLILIELESQFDQNLDTVKEYAFDQNSQPCTSQHHLRHA